MSARETSTWFQQCWTFLRALKHAAAYTVKPFYAARCLYQRWMTVCPTSVTYVLFVCHGNICRSPFAAAYFQSLVMKRGMPLTVKSAGLDTTPGKPAHSNTKALGEQQELSLAGHVTTRLEADLVNQSDLIIVMEIAQKNRVQHLYPASRGKVVLLGYFDPKGPLEISDPFGTPLDNFKICFQQVTRCCDNLVDRLSLNGGEPHAGRVSATSSENA